MAIIHTFNGTGTTSAGTFASTILSSHSICKLILIKPTTATTTYDFKLVDVFDNKVYHAEDLTGEHNELIELPNYGNLTLTVLNASADESFEFFFSFLEKL